MASQAMGAPVPFSFFGGGGGSGSHRVELSVLDAFVEMLLDILLGLMSVSPRPHDGNQAARIYGAGCSDQANAARQMNANRTYTRADSVVFLKTREQFGGLSNMAGGFPLRVNDVDIRSSEALYQACRFPHRPEVQDLVLKARSPMGAKIDTGPYRHDTRHD